MEKLKIDRSDGDRGTETYRVTGFKDGELYEIKDMPHAKAEDEIIRILDERNGNKGTCWAQGYGIYGVWFDNDAAYLRVGNSCD